MKIRNFIAVIVIPLLITSCGKKKHTSLETVAVEVGELTETVTATGTIESVTQVDVGTQVTGIIDKLYADYNSVVSKGELIAEIEKTLLESDLRSAEANVESARLTYEYNLTNYNRDKALYDKQLISEYEFQTSEKDLQVSKTAYDKAQADKVRAAKNLNYAEIYSPIDGIVISRAVEVGQTVVSNMNVANLYTIADLDNMQVIGNVDEADIGRVKVGQNVSFYVDAYPDEIFKGQVTQVRLNPTTESNVVTYEVVVRADNPDHKLIPGLTANLTIYVLQENDVMLLPVKAFHFTPQEDIEDESLPKPQFSAHTDSEVDNRQTVWVLRDNQLHPTLVTTGATNSVKTQIVSGLKPGDVVAVGYSESDDNEENRGSFSPFAPKPPSKKIKTDRGNECSERNNQNRTAQT